MLLSLNLLYYIVFISPCSLNQRDNMTKERQIQQAKEEAVLLGIRANMALYRRRLEIWGLRADNSKEFISQSTDHDNLWKDALAVLKRASSEKREPEPTGSLT